MIQEKQLIDVCKKLVEQKYQLPPSESWKQRDFEYLSDLIVEKTHVRLSVSTLKRIWKDYDNRTPQTHTLNILANLLDYANWNDFKRLNMPEVTIPEVVQTHHSSGNNGREKKARTGILYAVALIALLSFGYAGVHFFQHDRKNNDLDKIIFKSKKSVLLGVPNTVVFNYDISQLDIDSAFIQHSWDQRMRARVSKDNHFQTFIYYYPGYHTAKLIVNDKIIKVEKVNIATDGWEAIVDDDSSGPAPHYVPKNELFANDRLYVTRETLLKNNIPVRDKKFFIDYFNVREFPTTQASDFTLQTRIKDTIEEGAFVCQYSQVTLLCENGRISIPFCNPGCVSTIHLHVSEIFRDGKKSDLTAFGIDLSDWRDIRIECKNKNITVYVDNKPVYEIVYGDELGKITGLNYRFYGSGSVDYVRLYNEKNELSYADDFTR